MVKADSPQLQPKLLRWFDGHKRDLPWRNTTDPYAIWVSEVMLQQTQVATVIPYWQRFLARFPTVSALADAPLPDVLSLWKGLGYYSRARNLHRAAQAVRAAGKLPARAEELRKLPGFGRYTAGAVASIAFGERVPLVDGNVARVFARLFEVEGAPGEQAREAQLWSIAEQLVPWKRAGDWNQALMELGATVCKPDNPSCLLCPLRSDCGALKSGRVAELPPRRVRAERKKLHLAVAVWERKGKFLFARREEKGLFGGLWELPSAELKKSAAASLKAALGPSIELGENLGTVQRTLTHRDLRLELYRVVKGTAPRRCDAYRELRWVDANEVDSLGISTAMQKAVELALSQ
jgi:A/G-specific adenine glycosylase